MIARFFPIGHVALTLPVVYEAALENPDVRFVMVTRWQALQMWLNPPSNLYVHGIDTTDYSTIPRLRRLCRELKEEFHPDIFVDLCDSMHTTILRTWFKYTGVKCILFNSLSDAKKHIVKNHPALDRPFEHAVSRFAKAIGEAGVKIDSQIPNFSTLFHSDPAPDSLLPTGFHAKHPAATWIAIAPLARHDAKIYPLHKMAQVISHFARHRNTLIWLLGQSERDTRVLEQLKKGQPNVINLGTFDTRLSALLGLLSHCDLLLSMDTEYQHYASLAGTKALTIWGPTHPAAGTFGWRQSEEDAIQIPLECRPCSIFGQRPCKRHDLACLRNISPSEIINHIHRILEDKKKDQSHRP